MDTLTRHDLLKLIQRTPGPCASIYLPTHRTGKEVREDPIRCKNLLTEAERQLQSLGLAATQVRTWLEPAWRVQDASQRAFWEHQSDGLALLVDAGGVQFYRLPLPFTEQVVVGEHFYIKPLLPYLEGDGRFYLLAVSQNRVRFLQGSRYSVSELAPEVLPQNMATALNIDEFIESRQMRGFREVGSVPENHSIFHGQGGSSDDRKKGNELVEYFRRLDAALQEYFTSETAPLVFAGVEYLFPIFAKCNHYAALLDQPLVGNPDLMSVGELHQRAWELVMPEFQKKQQAAREQFGLRQSRQMASDDLNEVVQAAREGAVEVLLLQEQAAAWGTIDEHTGEIQIHAEQTPHSRDLLDDIAAHTLSNGGTVYALPAEQMPTSEPAAVLLRFPITWPARVR